MSSKIEIAAKASGNQLAWAVVLQGCWAMPPAPCPSPRLEGLAPGPPAAPCPIGQHPAEHVPSGHFQPLAKLAVSSPRIHLWPASPLALPQSRSTWETDAACRPVVSRLSVFVSLSLSLFCGTVWTACGNPLPSNHDKRRRLYTSLTPISLHAMHLPGAPLRTSLATLTLGFLAQQDKTAFAP